MASWMCHFRLAEMLLDDGFDLDVEAFLIGNIAPDSGVPQDDGSFDPPRTVTHWDGDFGMRPEAFAAAYLSQPEPDPACYAFLLGYYLHIVTDVLWVARLVRPLMHFNLHMTAQFFVNPDNERIARDDLFAHDAAYLRANPAGIYTRFERITHSPDYLDYFQSGLLTRTVQRIQTFYADADRLTAIRQHEYVYILPDRMDIWLRSTATTLTALLHALNAPCVTTRPL